MVESSNARFSKWSAAVIAAALVLAALAGYFARDRLSEPEAADPMQEFLALPETPPAAAHPPSMQNLAPVEVMLVRLEQRLQQQPDDVEGWILLAKSYYHLNRQGEAQASFERALALGYAGDWQPLPRIDAYADSGPAAIGFDSRGAGNARDDSAALPGVKLKVSLDPALARQLPAESTVYVFLRAAGRAGPPLAVIRRTLADLPFEIALDDSHAMMPGAKISAADSLLAGARISPSGNPERRPGDYEQLSDPIPSGHTETVELVIKDRI